MMIRHIYQYELDFACTSASGILYTLAKEKLKMSTFSKTLIATAMAVAVAGPVNADPNFIGGYSGSKTRLDITPSGCPNLRIKDRTTVVAFTPGIFEWTDEFLDVYEINIPFAGCWTMNGWQGILDPELDVLSGTYIERKPGKDLTMAATFSSIEGIVDAMNVHLITEGKCDVDPLAAELEFQGVNAGSVSLRKGQGKLSKNGERIKVDIRIDATYGNNRDQTRNINARVRGTMDYAPAAPMLYSCADAIVDFTPCEELNEVCAD
jgi:hypothetical protein